MKRLFVVIPLNEAWQRTLTNWIASQPNYFPWIESEKWHVTVQFLGDVRSEDDAMLCSELKSYYQTVPSFFLSLFSISPFPSLDPSMIWANVKQSAPLESVVRFTRQTTNLYIQGTLETRTLLPHVTLARLRKEDDLEALSFPASRLNSSMMHVQQIELWETVQTQRGQQYQVVDVFPLQT